MAKLQPEIDAKGGVGPLFVSIGDSKKLDKFLELNPLIPRRQAFVDDYEFGAYGAAGLGKMEMGQDVPEGIADKMSAPDLGGIGGWWNYLSNVMDLSPIPEGKAMEFPEGVKMLGGTFVVDGDEVVFTYKDPVPGVTPDTDAILAAI